MQKAILIGRLVTDPEITITANDSKVAKLVIAVKKDKPTADGEESNFYTCTSWRSIEFIEQYLTKGTKVAVFGKLNNHKYTDKDGIKRVSTQIIVDEIEFA